MLSWLQGVASAVVRGMCADTDVSLSSNSSGLGSARWEEAEECELSHSETVNHIAHTVVTVQHTTSDHSLYTHNNNNHLHVVYIVCCYTSCHSSSVGIRCVF